MKDRFLDKIKVAKNFITDTPKDFKNMQDRFKNIHWTVKVTGILIEGSIIASCFGEKPPTANSSELFCVPKNSGNESTKTDNERFNDTRNSFLKVHPEDTDRMKDSTTINFTINGINANTIAFPSTTQEKDEIGKGEYKIEGETVTPYSDAIVWTLQTNPDCSEEWVKLAGVQYLNPDESINTIWYSPEGLNENGDVDYKKVFAFNSKASEYVFYPLVVPPNAIYWNDDLSVTDGNEYEPWNGIDPFVLPVSLIPDGPAKNGLLSLVPVEIPVSEEFNKVQEEVAKTETHTAIPNQPWEVEIDGTIVKFDNIIPRPDGTVEITYEDQKYIIKSVTVNGEIITFDDEKGNIFKLETDLFKILSQEQLDQMGVPDDAKLGKDKNGNPIYFVTNPAGEQVTVIQRNAENKWEKADSVKYKIFTTVEEAEASGQVMDTEFVLRGGPGQVAKLNGEPFPENVITGLNIEVVKPNWNNPNSDQLNFDANGLALLVENPNQAPFRLAGYFLYENILNGVKQPGYGQVWRWTNPDGSYVHITTITSLKISSSYVLTPFANFNLTSDLSAIAPILDKIGHDEEINRLMLQWAETDVVPTELQDRALRISYRFK